MKEPNEYSTTKKYICNKIIKWDHRRLGQDRRVSKLDILVDVILS